MIDLNRQALEDASAWFVEFRTDSLNSGHQKDFMDWLRRSPEHIRAYLEVSRTYVQLPGEGDVAAAETERLLSKARARLEDSVVSIDCVRSLNATQGSARCRRVSFPRALAASVLLAAVGAFLVWSVSQRGLYTTAGGEERTVALADGSRIQLNGRTRLRVAYSAKQRDVRLIEGQALFHVAKDKSRPFVVDTETAAIRAVGTEFDVQQKGTETTVSVVEGTVAVLSLGPAHDSPAARDLMVTAGEQAVVTSQGSAKHRPRAINVAAATAWTRGQLEFDETPLAEVAEEFNRSSPRSLKLVGSAADALRISGIYSSVDPGSLILFLRSQPDLEVIESPEQIVISTKLK